MGTASAAERLTLYVLAGGNSQKLFQIRYLLGLLGLSEANRKVRPPTISNSQFLFASALSEREDPVPKSALQMC